MNSRQTIIIDIDGVILNFTKAFADWWNESDYDQIKLTENPHDWHFDHPDFNLILKGVREYVHTGKPYQLLDENIPQYLSKLKQKYYIHLLTAFPKEYSHFRIENLQMYNIPYDQITFGHNPKLPLVQEINPVAIIEDSPNNIRDFLQSGYTVYVPNYWNYTQKIENHPNMFRYNDWTQIRDYFS